MQENVRKEEGEEQLGYKITDKLFEEALNLAEHKQKYIYMNRNRGQLFYSIGILLNSQKNM